MTFTLSPGNDARASGIRLEEMWVGEINRYTERQIYRGRWIIVLFFFFRERERLWESVPLQICGVILMDCDVLCHVSVMMADVCVLNRHPYISFSTSVHHFYLSVHGLSHLFSLNKGSFFSI